jgi:hypothetical protein
MTAPTEAEIRAAVSHGLPEPFSIDDVGLYVRPVIDSDHALVRAGWTEDWNPGADHPGTLWADMRASESEALHKAVYHALHAAELAFRDTLVEGVTAAVIAFAEAHPDIPRGTFGVREPVTA